MSATAHPSVNVEATVEGTDQAVTTYLPAAYLLRQFLAAVDRDDRLFHEMRMWTLNRSHGRRHLAVEALTTAPQVLEVFALVDTLDEAERLRDLYDEASMVREGCACGAELLEPGDLLGPACREAADNAQGRQL